VSVKLQWMGGRSRFDAALTSCDLRPPFLNTRKASAVELINFNRENSRKMVADSLNCDRLARDGPDSGGQGIRQSLHPDSGPLQEG
jgi:hypothetical protein